MNLIAVPVMSFFMMPLALVALFLMPIGLDAPVLKLLAIFINTVINCADWIAGLPGSVWHVGYITSSSLFVFTFGCFWVYFFHTSWRFLGLLIIIISLLMMAFTQKPDFIYDYNLKIVGAKNTNSQLELYAKDKIPSFIFDYWVSWYGQKTAKVNEMDTIATNQIVKTNSGKTISLNYSNCIDADLLIITSQNLKCKSNNPIINYDDLQRHKQVLVFCYNNKPCKTTFAREKIWGK
jgi:hypothetical protein